MEEGRGVGKGVPQLVLAGASLDDVFVIVLFGTFLGMAQGEGASAAGACAGAGVDSAGNCRGNPRGAGAAPAV